MYYKECAKEYLVNTPIQFIETSTKFSSASDASSDSYGYV